MKDTKENRMLELKLRPHWDEVERAREACRIFLAEQGMSEDSNDALCMISSEILENAIKYGNFSGENPEFTYRIEAGEDGMLVQVWSPIPREKTEENLGRLDSIIQWIRSFQSPFQAYLERLKLVAGQPLEDTESGLGLLRIAYEGEAILDFFVNEEDILQISALQPKSDRGRMVAV